MLFGDLKCGVLELFLVFQGFLRCLFVVFLIFYVVFLCVFKCFMQTRKQC